MQTIFVECICDNPDIIATTMREELETSPDYRGVPPAEALRNLEVPGPVGTCLGCALEPCPLTRPMLSCGAGAPAGQLRVAHYQRRYETINQDNLSYVKLINAGERLKVNNVKGYLPVRPPTVKGSRGPCLTLLDVRRPTRDIRRGRARRSRASSTF